VDGDVTFIGTSGRKIVSTESYRLIHMSVKPSPGSFDGMSDPGYLGNSPYPSSVMYMFTVFFLVKFDPVRVSL